MLLSLTPRLFAVLGTFSALAVALPPAGQPANTTGSAIAPVALTTEQCQTNQNYAASSPCYNAQTNVRTTNNRADAEQRNAQLTCATGSPGQCGAARSNADKAQSLRSGAVVAEQTTPKHR